MVAAWMADHAPIAFCRSSSPPNASGNAAVSTTSPVLLISGQNYITYEPVEDSEVEIENAVTALAEEERATDESKSDGCRRERVEGSRGHLGWNSSGGSESGWTAETEEGGHRFSLEEAFFGLLIHDSMVAEATSCVSAPSRANRLATGRLCSTALGLRLQGHAPDHHWGWLTVVLCVGLLRRLQPWQASWRGG